MTHQHNKDCLEEISSNQFGGKCKITGEIVAGMDLINTNQQILERAIAKAIEGGYIAMMPKNILGITVDNPSRVLIFDGDKAVAQSWEQIVFNKRFAKALWGEEERKSPYAIPKEERGGSFTGGGTKGSPFEVITKKGWERHLQAMVIAPDPIKYLADNI